MRSASRSAGGEPAGSTTVNWNLAAFTAREEVPRVNLVGKGTRLGGAAGCGALWRTYRSVPETDTHASVQQFLRYPSELKPQQVGSCRHAASRSAVVPGTCLMSWNGAARQPEPNTSGPET